MNNNHSWTTDVEFGIRDVVPGEPRQVEEGKSLTFTIGFLKDDIELDSDFILGYSVKISATVAGVLNLPRNSLMKYILSFCLF